MQGDQYKTCDNRMDLIMPQIMYIYKYLTSENSMAIITG
jgi:hypothetical protein